MLQRAVTTGCTVVSQRALSLRVRTLRTALSVAGARRCNCGSRCGLDVGGNIPDEGDNCGRRSGHELRSDRDLGLAQERCRVFALHGEHDRDDLALLASASGAPTAVQVRLVFGGRVNVDHEFDVIDVNTACGNIRCDKNARLARRKRSEVAVASHLREVSVQVDRRDARVREALRELLGVVLRAHEQDATARARRERLDEFVLLVDAGNLEHVVGHRGDVRVGFVYRVQNLVVKVATHELVDAVIERRAEEQSLAGLGRLVHDARDDGQEPEVGHVVCLVQHRDFDCVEVGEALLHEVFEAARARDDDIDARLECGNLALLRNATEDRRDRETVRGCEGLHRDGDLGREFARRREHESERSARAALAAREGSAESRDHRDGEGQSLARPRLSAAEHVAPREGVWQRVELDGEGIGNSRCCECGNEGSRHAKRAES